MADRVAESWWRPILLAIGMIALGRAIHINDSILAPGTASAIAWLTIAIVATGVGIFVPAKFPFSRRAFQIVAIAGVLFNGAQLATRPSDNSMHLMGGGISPITTGAIAISVVAAFTLAVTGTLRLVAFGGVLIGTALLGAWIITTKPAPLADLYMFQTDSSAALAAGRNPYELTFPEIYGPPYSWYGKGIAAHGRLWFGYPYLPESLLVIMPAKLLGFDFRLTQLGAMLLTAIGIVAISPTLRGYSAAALLITTPRIFYVLGIGYIEPFVALTLAATVVAAMRWPRVLPITLGLFLASKQYSALAIVLVFIEARPWRETLSLVWKAIIVALIVTLPLALWNVRAFWKSAVALQFRQPFRTDALSFLAWANAQTWPTWTVVAIPFGLFGLTMALALWRRRTVGFAGAVAISFLIFFSFNKQAFANYYFFALAAMACGIADNVTTPDVEVARQLPPRKVQLVAKSNSAGRWAGIAARTDVDRTGVGRARQGLERVSESDQLWEK